MSKRQEEGMAIIRLMGDMGALDRQDILGSLKETFERAGMAPPTKEELQEIYLKVKEYDARRSHKRNRSRKRK